MRTTVPTPRYCDHLGAHRCTALRVELLVRRSGSALPYPSTGPTVVAEECGDDPHRRTERPFSVSPGRRDIAPSTIDGASEVTDHATAERCHCERTEA